MSEKDLTQVSEAYNQAAGKLKTKKNKRKKVKQISLHERIMIEALAVFAGVFFAMGFSFVVWELGKYFSKFFS